MKPCTWPRKEVRFSRPKNLNSRKDLEPRQGEPTQTNRDYKGPLGAMNGLVGGRALRAFLGCPSSFGEVPLGTVDPLQGGTICGIWYVVCIYIEYII